MSKRELVARTLCRASAYHGHCRFCEDNRGICMKQMWETFQVEADAVLAALDADRRLLPGLGGRT